MDNYLADSSSVSYGGILASVKPQTETRVIETQMLDGSFVVQNVGDPAVKVAVEYYGSTATRRLLETAAAESDTLEVYWRDQVYTGIISTGQIAYERWSRNSVTLAEKITFTLLAIEVAAR